MDLAHDDHSGQTANIATCRRWLDEGLFSLGKRPPKTHLVDDLGTGGGCTLYVGNRGNGKLFRGYENGKQLGDAASPWFRVEVELRAKDRTIPLDVLTNPTPYLAEAFPALAFLSSVQNKIKTIKKAVETSFEKARNAAGKLVNVLAEFCIRSKRPLFAVLPEANSKVVTVSALPKLLVSRRGATPIYSRADYPAMIEVVKRAAKDLEGAA